MEKLLEIKDVSLIYHSPEGETEALKNVNFDVGAEEFVAIVGPSGCGKTTLLAALAGLVEPSGGTISLDGSPIKDKLALIGLMPQRDHLFEWRSILNNVTLGLEVKKNKTPETVEYAKSLLEKYGLGDFIKKHPSELSGGMRQRAALIRTLVTSPKLLLLDEPFSALDFQTRLKVCDDVHKIIKEEKKTAILVSHDISEAISMADKIVVLTPRPATVREVYEIKLDKSLPPLKRREQHEFPAYFRLIWNELENDDV